MAYGTKYRIKWATPTADCRLRLQQDGYSSGVTDLEPATKTFALEWKRTDANQDLTLPLKISTGTIRVIGDSTGTQVKEVFDSGDTEWRVLFDRDTGGGYELEWQGFVADDLYSDDPHRDYEAIELPVLDGLALLEDRDFNPSSANDLYTTLRTILRGLHQLDVVANMEWYPYRSGNQLSGNQLPLYYLDTAQNAFDELEPIEGETGFESTDDRPERLVLEAILERFGMEVFQSRGEWVVRQRHQIDSNGEIKMWPSQSEVTNDNPSTRDLNRSLGALPPRERPRGLIQRLRTVESVHDYTDLSELIADPSFESGFGKWSSPFFGANASRLDYGNTPVGGSGTQDNNWVMRMEFSTSDPVDLSQDHLEQNIPAVLHNAGPEAGYTIRARTAVESLGDRSTMKLFTSNYGLRRDTIGIKQEADPAEEGTLLIDPLPGSNDAMIIPAGATLQIFRTGPEQISTITLSKPAFAGDETLVGSITERVEWPSGDDAFAEFFYWESNTKGGITWPKEPEFVEQMVPQKVSVPQNAIDGTPVTGDMTMRLGTALNSTGFARVWVDNLSLKITKRGQPIEQTSYTVRDDQAGRNIEIEQLIGDGPTFKHPRALQLSGVDVTRDWQVGAYAAGDPRSGQSIEEITAEAAMRQQRDSLQRRTHTVELRGNEELWPEDVFTIDGDLYTVSRLQRTFGTSGDVAEVELSQLKGAGTSGLSRTFEMQADDTAGGGGGTAGTSGDGSGTVSAAWSQITGKPDSLLIDPTATDNIAETQPLDATDIAESLSHSPGLSDGIQTSIRATPTDAALVTEEAVDEAIGSVNNLDALSDVRLDKSTKYQTTHILVGDGSDEYTDKEASTVLSDTLSLPDLQDVDSASQSNGNVLAVGDPASVNWREEGIAALTNDHVTIGDHKGVGVSGLADGQVLSRTGGGSWTNETLSGMTNDHVKPRNLVRVQDTDPTEDGVALLYVKSNSQYEPRSIPDFFEDRGTLTIGDVGVGSDGKSTVSTNPPPSPSNHSFQDGYVWIQRKDFDSDGIRETKRFAWQDDKNQWKELSTGIAGGLLANESIFTQHIEAESLAVGSATINTANIDSLTAGVIQVTNDSAQSQTLIKGSGIDTPSVQTEIFQGADATITNTLTVGNSAPNILVDGSNAGLARVESTDYASLTSGFRLESDTDSSYIEAADLRARMSIKSAVFEVDEQVLRGGTDIVTPAAVLDQDAQVGDTTIEVRTQRFQAGDDIRFKEGGTSEIRTISSISGTTITLNNGLNNAWTTGAAIARWNAERIVHDAGSTNAPFSAYIDDQDREVGRVGNIAGRAGQVGYGIVFGLDDQLVYSTSDDTLAVKGLVEATEGNIGEFDITNSGLSGAGMFLSTLDENLEFLSGAAQDVTSKLTNPDFSNGLTGWTEVVNTKTGTDANGDYIYPGADRSLGNQGTAWRYEIYQDIDLSGQEGNTMQIDIKNFFDTGYGVYVEVIDRVANERLIATHIGSFGAVGRSTTSVQLPQNDASDIRLRLSPGESSPYIRTNTPEQDHRVYDVDLTIGRVRSRFNSDGVELFDSSGTKRGGLSSAGTLTYSGPPSITVEQELVATGTSTTLSGQQFAGNTSIPVNSASGFEVGNIIKLDYQQIATRDFIYRVITSIGQNGLGFDEPLPEQISGGQPVTEYSVGLTMPTGNSFFFKMGNN